MPPEVESVVATLDLRRVLVGENGDQRHPQRVDVRCGYGIRLILFERHVAVRPDDGRSIQAVQRETGLYRPEVDEIHVAFVAEEDVAGLYVAVDERWRPAVQVFENPGDPPRNADNFLLREVTPLVDELTEVPCVHVLLDDVELGVVFRLDGERVDEFGNPGMVQVGENLPLALEQLHDFRRFAPADGTDFTRGLAVRVPDRQRLHHTPIARLLVDRDKRGGETSLAQLCLDPIAIFEEGASLHGSPGREGVIETPAKN